MIKSTTKNGVTLRVFSPPGRAAHGKFALDCGVRALDFYDEFFQVFECGFSHRYGLN
jgi:aminopeptidase N